MDKLKYEGFLYIITAVNTPQPGLFQFERDPGTPKISGTYRQGTGNMADLQTGNPSEGFKFLPGRCAPLLLPRIQAAEKAGVFARAGVSPRAFMDAVQNHPLYAAGRDDLAESLISGAYGVVLPDRLPEGFIPPSLLD